MMFAVVCDAKSQTRLWPSRSHRFLPSESGVAHFSGVLVLLCVACVKQGLHLDRNTFCYAAKELTSLNRLYVRLARVACRDC